MKGKIVATFPSRVRTEFGTGRWQAFQSQVNDSFAMLTGVCCYWHHDGQTISVIAPGETWDEADEETRRLIATPI